MGKLNNYELYEGQSWNKYLSQDNFFEAYKTSPLEMENVMKTLLRVQDGTYSMVDRIKSFGTDTIEADKNSFGWYIENNSSEKYPLVAAYEDRAMSRTVGTTPGFRAGANQTAVYFLFKGNPFSITELIGGKRGNRYQWLIFEDEVNVGGDRFLYKAHLSGTTHPDDFCPIDEFDANSLWIHKGGATASTRSERGFELSYKTHGAMKNWLSSFRMETTLDGNMLNMKAKPLAFTMDNGKNMLWTSTVELEFMRKKQKAEFEILMNGLANVGEDGVIQNVDKAGNKVRRGGGFKALTTASNVRRWVGEPDADVLLNHILDIVIATSGDRSADIICGEYGYKALEQAFVKRYGGSSKFQDKPWVNDGTGRAFEWSGNALTVKNGQIKKVIEVNDIVLHFIIDKSKDYENASVNKHPLGGPVSSYEYDIIGLGGTKGTSNYKIVRRKDEPGVWGTVRGMRSMGRTTGGSFTSNFDISTGLDASTIHFMDPGLGAKVYDPTAVIKYYPVESYI